eukprot:TRINITY_DN27620_c0_g1_i1.p1 TRINITY_DN27620_c0_g1~~TRINITY_DN27620_c0_g1_i1.p1  ORF type:complete len:928 (-),score=206.00 TRINITY_DN27620_c0_g1_i1:257-3040(-)
MDSLFEGFLTKQGAIRRNWKTRWFVLENGVMRYYKHRTARKPAGSFVVRGMRCGAVLEGKIKRPFSFQVITQKRTWYMYATNDAEFRRWREQLIAQGGIWDSELQWEDGTSDSVGLPRPARYQTVSVVQPPSGVRGNRTYRQGASSTGWALYTELFPAEPPASSAPASSPTGDTFDQQLAAALVDLQQAQARLGMAAPPAYDPYDLDDDGLATPGASASVDTLMFTDADSASVSRRSSTSVWMRRTPPSASATVSRASVSLPVNRTSPKSPRTASGTISETSSPGSAKRRHTKKSSRSTHGEAGLVDLPMSDADSQAVRRESGAVGLPRVESSTTLQPTTSSPSPSKRTAVSATAASSATPSKSPTVASSASSSGSATPASDGSRSHAHAKPKKSRSKDDKRPSSSGSNGSASPTRRSPTSANSSTRALTPDTADSPTPGSDRNGRGGRRLARRMIKSAAPGVLSAQSALTAGSSHPDSSRSGSSRHRKRHDEPAVVAPSDGSPSLSPDSSTGSRPRNPAQKLERLPTLWPLASDSSTTLQPDDPVLPRDASADSDRDPSAGTLPADATVSDMPAAVPCEPPDTQSTAADRTDPLASVSPEPSALSSESFAIEPQPSAVQPRSSPAEPDLLRATEPPPDVATSAVASEHADASRTLSRQSSASGGSAPGPGRPAGVSPSDVALDTTHDAALVADVSAASDVAAVANAVAAPDATNAGSDARSDGDAQTDARSDAIDASPTTSDAARVPGTSAPTNVVALLPPEAPRRSRTVSAPAAVSVPTEPEPAARPPTRPTPTRPASTQLSPPTRPTDVSARPTDESAQPETATTQGPTAASTPPGPRTVSVAELVSLVQTLSSEVELSKLALLNSLCPAAPVLTPPSPSVDSFQSVSELERDFDACLEFDRRRLAEVATRRMSRARRDPVGFG